MAESFDFLQPSLFERIGGTASEGGAAAARRVELSFLRASMRLKAEYRAAIRREKSGEASAFDEMFADEFYNIEKHLKLASDGFSDAGFKKLPVLSAGGEKLPRLFALAKAYLDICELHLEASELGLFLAEYQKSSCLTTGELTKLDFALRLALIEKTARLVSAPDEDESGRMGKLRLLLAGLTRLGDEDMAELSERLNAADGLLRSDEIYKKTDRQSRCAYLDSVASFAKKARVSESAVARAAVELAREAAENGEADRECHVGFYLIAEGKVALKARLSGGAAPKHDVYSISKNSEKTGLFILVSVKLILTLLLCAALLRLGSGIPCFVLGFIPLSVIADALIFRVAAIFKKPRPLARLEKDGITAAKRRTLVCVPVLITDEAALEESIKRIEQHYIASGREGEYCVLGDFPDAKQEQKNGEAELLKKAESMIIALNARYGTKGFHFLHRKRRYFAPDGIYMGRERKRGAIEDLLFYMTEGETGDFILNAPELSREFDFLTVLDADTVLPSGALDRLVGAAVHPLNRPFYADESAARPIAGYNIIVPRMCATSRSAAKTRFSALISGESGMDTYSSRVSDFFFDSFSSGNFGGKGIINIHGFARAVRGRIRENTVLSHDLLEGELSRAGYDSSTVLYDGEPSTFFSWWKRRHRWLRGDIQLIGYAAKRGDLGALSRYKLISNIIAGLYNISVFTALFVGALFARPALVGAALGSFFIAPIMMAAEIFIRALRERVALRELIVLIRRRLLELATLPYAAYRDADAIIRALYRSFVSHRRMLEWQTAASAGMDKGKKQYLKLLPCSAAGLALAAVCVLRLINSDQGFFAAAEYLKALFAGILESCAPAICIRLDKNKKEYEFSDGEKALLLDIAKRTWKFFAENCNEKTHFLPPDNFQLEPYLGAADHTSPTNIGMYLVSAVAARDLGFISAEELCFRLEKTAETLEKLEKWQGNFFNWYNVHNLSLLKPRFVSSVDCGNLFCSLVTASEAAAESGKTELSNRLYSLASGMELSELYDKKRRLFYIGREFDEGRMTGSRYDLYASESRILSFCAVAFNKADHRHFASLSRLFTDASGGRTLKSWSGTAFEYLMPLIFFETAERSLQYEMAKSAVLTQVLSSRGELPWGVSESGYYCFDGDMKYQYRAFGEPALALERRRERERVIAPYASALSLAVERKLSVDNIKNLVDKGALGEYGLYEALDMTESRVGNEPKFVASFMAHHQGMILCAIDNALVGGIKKRFMKIPCVAANEQLLFENFPSAPIKLSSYKSAIGAEKRRTKPPVALYSEPDAPLAGIVSNGKHSLIVGTDGSGVSFLGETLLTRNRAESGSTGGVQFAVSTGRVTKLVSGALEIEPHKLTVNSRIGAVKARLEHFVSAEDGCEVRCLTLINGGREEVRCAVGAFAEIALEKNRADEAHPAFTELNIDCALPERSGQENTLVFLSRRNAGSETGAGFFNISAPGEVKLFSDALCVPGRGGDILAATERYLKEGETISAGGMTKPYFSALTGMTLGAGRSGSVLLICGFAKNEAEAHERIARQKRRMDTLEALARARTALNLRELAIGQREFELVCRLAYCLLTDTPAGKTAESGADMMNIAAGREALYRFSVSLDVPLIVLKVDSIRQLENVKCIINSVKYLLRCGMKTEMAVIGEYPYEYENALRRRLEELLRGAEKIRLVHGFELDARERALLYAAALIVMDADEVALKVQKTEKTEKMVPIETDGSALEHRPLFDFNGYGGFDLERGEYLMRLKSGMRTPLPWSNILAGGRVGSLVTESGGGYTFFDNARLFRITPWSNDALRDRRGERLALIDADTRETLALPPVGAGGYEVAHGFGYTRFFCAAGGLLCTLIETVDDSLPVKLYCIDIENKGSARNLIAEFELDFVLGENLRREHIICSAEPWGVLAANPLSQRKVMAFAALKTGGRLGSVKLGASSTLRAGLAIEKGEKRRIVFLLGCAETKQAAEEIINTADFDAAMEQKRCFKKEKLERLLIDTGDLKRDIALNGLLLHQLYSSRLGAKTGFYQSGGATGFRDQLQDASALILTDPDRTKLQLFECARMQFKQGDVLHWRHDTLRGVRTRISDDRLFLPLVAADYASGTGDYAVFDEVLPYLEDKPLREGEKTRYELFESSTCSGSLFEHSLRAVEFSLSNLGAHGLPLMGGGDWNDGMDEFDRGSESTVTGLLALLAAQKLSSVAEKRGDRLAADGLKAKAEALRVSLEGIWNGRSYPRAFFGDGTPLDIADCVTAAFAVFAGLKHAKENFDHAASLLVCGENGLIRLLWPPFERGSVESGRRIGYIENYRRGVRENGGQYTHAAAWLTIAACKLGMAETAERFFKMLNPVEHGGMNLIERYRTEPYAVCGDVYSVGSTAGRGGWSLYTGAAGWLYRAAVEHILGIKRRGKTLVVSPCTTLDEFSFSYRFGKDTVYRVHALRGKTSAGENEIKLIDDGRTHELTIKY